MSREDMRDTVRRVAQNGTASDHAHYWATRYGLARDAQARSVVLQEITRLPESLRWAVAVEMALRHSETSEDAGAIARTIGSRTSTLIRTREIELPPDPIYQDEAHREGLFMRYDALMGSR